MRKWLDSHDQIKICLLAIWSINQSDGEPVPRFRKGGRVLGRRHGHTAGKDPAIPYGPALVHKLKSGYSHTYKYSVIARSCPLDKSELLFNGAGCNVLDCVATSSAIVCILQ